MNWLNVRRFKRSRHIYWRSFIQASWKFLLCSFIVLMLGLIPWMTAFGQVQASSSYQFGTSTAWSSEFNCLNGSSCNVGDFNGDGRDDIISFSQVDSQINVTPDVIVRLSTGSSFTNQSLWQSKFCALGEVCEVGDFNGDGKDDVVAFVHNSSAAVRVALSNGSGFGQSAVWSNGFCIDEQTCKVGDVNGDGKDDIVAFTPITGLVWTALSDGSKFGEPSVWHNFFCIRGEVCEVGDVNGDKKADAISFKSRAKVPVEKGNVLVAFSDGFRFKDATLGHGYFCVDYETCRVGDFNGDRKADISLFKENEHDNYQSSLVSLSNGSQFINTSPFTWNDHLYTCSNEECKVGDFNGDKREDIVHFLIPYEAPLQGQVMVSLTEPVPINPPPSERPNITFDASTFKGSGFRPNSTVYIRVVISGNINGYSDLRSTPVPYPQTTSDSQGNASKILNIKEIVQPYVSPYSEAWLGCYPGERVSISANDGRSNPKDLTGTLWSNTFTFSC